MDITDSVLSPLYVHSFENRGIIFPTIYHYVHYYKFKNVDTGFAQTILIQPAKFTNAHHREVPGWSERQFSVLSEAYRALFKTLPRIKVVALSHNGKFIFHDKDILDWDTDNGDEINIILSRIRREYNRRILQRSKSSSSLPILKKSFTTTSLTIANTPVVSTVLKKYSVSPRVYTHSAKITRSATSSPARSPKSSIVNPNATTLGSIKFIDSPVGYNPDIIIETPDEKIEDSEDSEEPTDRVNIVCCASCTLHFNFDENKSRALAIIALVVFAVVTYLLTNYG